MKQYYGKLASFFETGCEGSYWVLEQFEKEGYEQYVFLESADELTVYDEDGVEVYTGVIIQDNTINLHQRPMTSIMQPVCKGFWVHWLQPGVDVNLWGEWFFSGRFTGIIKRQC
jgi:hypothetical protein